jgi:hypothetical protein
VPVALPVATQAVDSAASHGHGHRDVHWHGGRLGADPCAAMLDGPGLRPGFIAEDIAALLAFTIQPCSLQRQDELESPSGFQTLAGLIHVICFITS